MMRDQPAPVLLNIDGLRRHSMANRVAGLSILTVVVLAVIGLKGTVRRPASPPAGLAVTHVSTSVERHLPETDRRERRGLEREYRPERSCGF